MPRNNPKTTLKNDLKNAEGKIEDLERQRTNFFAQNEALNDKLENAKIQCTKDKQTLTDELKQTKESLDLVKLNNQKTIEALKEKLKQISEDRDNGRAELKQYQLVSSKQSKDLKEVQSPTKETLSKREKMNVMDVDEKERRQKLMNKLFLHISGKLSSEWRFLGRELHLTDQELSNIEAERIKRQEIHYTVLRKWYQKNGSAATYTVLMNALQNVGRMDLAEYVGQFVRNWEGMQIE